MYKLNYVKCAYCKNRHGSEPDSQGMILTYCNIFRKIESAYTDRICDNYIPIGSINKEDLI